LSYAIQGYVLFSKLYERKQKEYMIEVLTADCNQLIAEELICWSSF